MADGLKLFVWHDALTDYTPGVMFALARTRDEAKALILAHTNYVSEGEFGPEPSVYEAPVGFAVYGGG